MTTEPMIDLQVPRSWLAGVADEPLTLQRIFRVGLYHYKIERALTLYREGVGSLGYIAEQLGLPKQELIRAARQQGLEPDWSEDSLAEDVG
jgi:hypothetical protein